MREMGGRGPCAWPGDMTGPPPRTWHLTVPERPDGRLAVTGLPQDRGERRSLTWRLCDVLAAVCHADDSDRRGQRRAVSAVLPGQLARLDARGDRQASAASR